MNEDLSSNSDRNRLSDDSGDEHVPSEQESATESSGKSADHSNDSSSGSDFNAPAKKKSRPNTKSDRDMVMQVIKSNPEDFGVRRSSRAGRSYSEGGSNSESASDDENFVKRAHRVTQRAAARSVKEVDYGISSEDSDDDEIKKQAMPVELDGDKIEKVLDSRDGPVNFTGNQTILYNEDDEKKKYLAEYDGETEHQYLIKWTGWSHLHNTWGN